MAKKYEVQKENATKESDDVYMGMKRRRMAMMDILMEAHRNGQIDYEGICEEVDTFTFEVNQFNNIENF